MPDSYQRLYDAAQAEFDVDELDADEVFAWITKRSGGRIKNGFDERGRQLYSTSQTTVQGQSKLMGLAQNIAEAGTVYEEANSLQVDTSAPAESQETLNTYYNQAQTLPVHRQAVLNTLLPKIEEANQAEATLIDVQEQIREFNERVDEIKALDIEDQKRIWKEGDPEQRRLAAVALREESPQTLGGLVRWKGRTKKDQRAITDAINSIF